MYRTVTNLTVPSRRLDDHESETEVAGSGSAGTSTGTSTTSEENRVEEDGSVEGISEAENAELSCRPGKKKSKTRAQIEREELADRIINFANKEDHPVDLELAALSARIKRKLPNSDDQDDLLDEIKDLARSFFNRKRRASEMSNVQTPTTSTVPAPPLVQQIPPPPLQRFPGGEQCAQQQQQHGAGDVLIQNEFNPGVNYLTDAASGATYMAI